jgi:predicted nucleic acid-binding protein
MNAIDTNVLVYAYDDSNPHKQRRAHELLESIGNVVLLWQVACEFVSASRKLLPKGADPAIAWERLDEARESYPLILPTENVLGAARSMQLENGIHYWDALLYAACIEAGVKRIYSEDLPGSVVAGLEVVNPFA